MRLCVANRHPADAVVGCWSSSSSTRGEKENDDNGGDFVYSMTVQCFDFIMHRIAKFPSKEQRIEQHQQLFGLRNFPPVQSGLHVLLVLLHKLISKTTSLYYGICTQGRINLFRESSSSVFSLCGWVVDEVVETSDMIRPKTSTQTTNALNIVMNISMMMDVKTRARRALCGEGCIAQSVHTWSINDLVVAQLRRVRVQHTDAPALEWPLTLNVMMCVCVYVCVVHSPAPHRFYGFRAFRGSPPLSGTPGTGLCVCVR